MPAGLTKKPPSVVILNPDAVVGIYNMSKGDNAW
jgi:hypothetical protein